MLSKDLVDMALRRIHIEFEERGESFAGEVRRIKMGAVGRNSYHSTETQQQISDAIGYELRIRAQLIWQVLVRILSTQPLAAASGVAFQLKELVRESMGTGCDDLLQAHELASNILPGSGAVRAWDSMRSFALDKVESEIDLSMLGVEQQSREQVGPQSTINVYQSFGIIQVGHGTSAVISFGEKERQQLQSALVAIQQAVEESEELQSSDIGNLQEVLEEARSEIEKPSPNRVRLQGALTAIAATIQTLGSARDAYSLLKGAAALFGVHLP